MKINVFGTSLLPPSARKPALIKKACGAALKKEGIRGTGELNVVFVDRREMLALNKKYLGRGHDTDVIAFNLDAPSFGDVYISAWKARAQARELSHSVLEETLTLALHGTLHLIGYDDATPRQKAAMFRKQDHLLGQIKAAQR